MDKIKELRMAKGLTQEQLCKKFEIPLSTYRKWEQGQHQPSKYLVNLLKNALENL